MDTWCHDALKSVYIGLLSHQQYLWLPVSLQSHKRNYQPIVDLLGKTNGILS